MHRECDIGPDWTLDVLNGCIQEFSTLTPENTVFKLVGPVLVKQDQNEAKQNVNTRLEFIQGEMYVFFLILPPYPASHPYAHRHLCCIRPPIPPVCN